MFVKHQRISYSCSGGNGFCSSVERIDRRFDLKNCSRSGISSSDVAIDPMRWEDMITLSMTRISNGGGPVSNDSRADVTL